MAKITESVDIRLARAVNEVGAATGHQLYYAHYEPGYGADYELTSHGGYAITEGPPKYSIWSWIFILVLRFLPYNTIMRIPCYDYDGADLESAHSIICGREWVEAANSLADKLGIGKVRIDES